jgi:hypothetical protein
MDQGMRFTLVSAQGTAIISAIFNNSNKEELTSVQMYKKNSIIIHCVWQMISRSRTHQFDGTMISVFPYAWAMAGFMEKNTATSTAVIKTIMNASIL